MTRLNRRTAYRGQTVTVTLKDGRTLTGTLTGWGTQIVEVAPLERTPEFPWKRHSFSVVTVASVEAV